MKKSYTILASIALTMFLSFSTNALAEIRPADDEPLNIGANFIVSPVKPSDDTEDNIADEDVYTMSGGNSGGTDSTGGSSGGSSVVVYQSYYSIEPVSFENGIITANLKVSNKLTDSDTLFAAVYEMDTHTLVTVAEVDFTKYHAINGDRRFAMQIPCDAEKDIIISLIGFSSMETLKPIQPAY